MQCGLGLDSRGGHENDGKRKTRTTQGMTIALPLRHSRALPGNPVLFPSVNPSGGKPAPLIPKNTQRLPTVIPAILLAVILASRRESSPVLVAAFLPVILAEGGNPECGLGLDSRGGHENDGKRKTRTTQGMTIALPLRHSRQQAGIQSCSHPSTRQAGNPPHLTLPPRRHSRQQAGIQSCSCRCLSPCHSR